MFYCITKDGLQIWPHFSKFCFCFWFTFVCAHVDVVYILGGIVEEGCWFDPHRPYVGLDLPFVCSVIVRQLILDIPNTDDVISNTFVHWKNFVQFIFNLHVCYKLFLLSLFYQKKYCYLSFVVINPTFTNKSYTTYHFSRRWTPAY